LKTIYKYPLENIPSGNIITMPADYELLTVDYDPNGEICLWAIVNTEVENTEVCIAILGTGWPMLEDIKHKYINTFKQGPYVWHAFEIEKE
jgi:hypothetical protein